MKVAEHAVHLARVMLIIAEKRLGSSIAEQPRAGREFLVGLGQGMGLRVVYHLQLVFDITKKKIRFCKNGALICRDDRLIAQGAQRCQSVPAPDLRESCTKPDLKRLCDQLDLANAAGSKLYVALLLVSAQHLLID